jgi:hypothetical protein
VVLAALRAYDPGLSSSQTEALIAGTAAGGVLDGGAAFRAAGLASVIDAGQAAMPLSARTTNAPNTVAQADVSQGKRAKWGRPIAKTARYRRGVLSVAVSGRPIAATLKVVVLRRVRGRLRAVKELAKTRSVIRLSSLHRPTEVRLSYLDSSGQGRAPLGWTLKTVR